ncbi:hypothetical protein ACFL1R_03135 [Candidatus Latescibacterota bacterium]
MKKTITCLLFLVVFSAFLTVNKCTGQTSEINNNTSPIYIGLADSNNILIPFAIYDKGTWTIPWPVKWYDEAGKRPPSTVYNRLDDIPKAWYKPLKKIPEKWHFFRRNGTWETMTIFKPALVYTNCDQRWAFVGDLTKKKKVGRAGNFFYRLSNELFLATSQQQHVQTVTTVDKKSDEWMDFNSFFKPLLTAYEDKSNHSWPKEVRTDTDITFFNLIRNAAPQNDTIIYFVEAKNEYSGSMRSQCISYFKGWMLRDKEGHFSCVDNLFKVYQAEMFFVSADIPLGIIHVDGKSYWVVRNIGYESEEYVLFEVSASGVKKLLSVSGGGVDFI